MTVVLSDLPLILIDVEESIAYEINMSSFFIKGVKLVWPTNLSFSYTLVDPLIKWKSVVFVIIKDLRVFTSSTFRSYSKHFSALILVLKIRTNADSFDLIDTGWFIL